MKRFISKPPQYTLLVDDQAIVIDNQRGFTTDDKRLIAAVTSHSDFGNLVFAVPTEAELNRQSKQTAKRILTAIAEDGE